MYLLLVDNEIFSSRQFQQIMALIRPHADIVNCISINTLERVAEKLSPEIIVIDFDLFGDDQVEIIESLRGKNRGAHIVALVDLDYFEILNNAIERELIDDYIIKPLRKEDFLARMHIIGKRTGRVADFFEPGPAWEQKEADGEWDFEAGEEEPENDPYYSLEVSKPEQEKEDSIFNGDFEPFENNEADLFKLQAEEAEKAYDPTELEPGPAVVRPAKEFLNKVQPDDGSEDALEDVEPFAGGHEETEKYFEDFFSDQPDSAEEESYTKPPLSEDETYEFFEPVPVPADKPGEIKPRSVLPGNSADDFLFGNEVQQDARSQSEIESGFFDDISGELIPRSQVKKKKKTGSLLGKVATIIFKFIIVILLLVVAALVFFLVQGRIQGEAPRVFGYQMYIVLSGSMSPEFDTGSLVLVREMEPRDLAAGDIITYRNPNNSNAMTTHRIVEVTSADGLKFITRGDANNVNDPQPVPAENVAGKVTGSVPYLGYVLDYAQTREGLLLLIIIPGLLIIAYEMNNIVKHLARKKRTRKRPEQYEVDLPG